LHLFLLLWRRVWDNKWSLNYAIWNCYWTNHRSFVCFFLSSDIHFPLFKLVLPLPKLLKLTIKVSLLLFFFVIVDWLVELKAYLFELILTTLDHHLLLDHFVYLQGLLFLFSELDFFLGETLNAKLKNIVFSINLFFLECNFINFSLKGNLLLEGLLFQSIELSFFLIHKKLPMVELYLNLYLFFFEFLHLFLSLKQLVF
jgi:hypothetical protein